MNVTLREYENAKKQLEKLSKHQETVKKWESAVKGYKAPDGHCVVEVQAKDGRTRFITEESPLKTG